MRKTVRKVRKLFERKKYSWEGRKHSLPIDQDLWDLTQQYVKDQIALMARHGSEPKPPLTDAQFQDLVYATAKYPQQVRNLRKKYEKPEDETRRANAV
jgi:hypothetical protein